MTKGDICRKITHEGVPYGPLMIVDRVTWRNVTCHIIEHGDNIAPIILQRNMVSILPSVRLAVPLSDLNRMMQKECNVYYHNPTKTWVKAAGSVPEIIVLTANRGKYRLYYKDCEIEKVLRHQGKKIIPSIRLELGKQLFFDYDI